MLLYAFLQILTSSPLLPSEVHTTKMVAEIYRVLSPGSRFITFSLHPAHEVVYKYDKPNQYSWKVSVISFNNNFIRLLIIHSHVCFLKISTSMWNPIDGMKQTIESERFLTRWSFVTSHCPAFTHVQLLSLRAVFKVSWPMKKMPFWRKRLKR